MKDEKSKQANLKMVKGASTGKSGAKTAVEIERLGNIAKKFVEQATTGPSPEAKSKISNFDFGALSKVLGGMVLVIGLSFHFFGHVAHEAFLTAWGIDPSQFTKSIYWTEVNGYYTLFDVLINSSSALMADNERFIILGICVFGIALYIYLINVLIVITKNKPSRKNIWIDKLPQWFRRLLFTVFMATAVIAFIPVMLGGVAVVLVIPGVIAQNRGEWLAREYYAIFQKGCENAPLMNRCFDLQKDGKKIARGFLIDGGERHIAVFDVDSKKARVIERKDLELIADPPSMPKPQQKAKK